MGCLERMVNFVLQRNVLERGVLFIAWMIMIGTNLNALVITANAGRMPITGSNTATLREEHVDHRYVDGNVTDTPLAKFGDTIHVTFRKNTYCLSYGDVLFMLGILSNATLGSIILTMVLRKRNPPPHI